MLIKLVKWLKRGKGDEKGFTLIELLIVIVIIGILAAVAVPTYTKYMVSAKAAAAFNGISAIVQYAEGLKVASDTGTDYPTLTQADIDDISPSTVNFTFAYAGGGTAAASVTATGQGTLAGADTIPFQLDTGVWGPLTGDLAGIAIPTQ